MRDDGLISRDVFNLEQVEVFMGPTGSDVGRGTAAGYVNMQTKTPHLRLVDSAALSATAPPISSALTADVNWRDRRRSQDSWLEQVARSA